MAYVPKQHQTIEEFQESRRRRSARRQQESPTLGCVCVIVATAIVVATVIAGVVIAS